MRVVQTPLTMIGCIVLGIASAAGQGPPSAAGAPSRPATINVPPPVQALRQLVVRYDDRKIASWPQRQVDGRPCRVSGVLSVPPGHEINLHRVTVVHNGVDHSIFKPSMPADLPRYILYVGTEQPRKNLPRLLAALRLLRQQEDITLIKVGRASYITSTCGINPCRVGSST
ncbi:hypothetical protein LCGC14_1548570 [marine sediment metagenome]|uniref:Uncharacterized protein n=1 Tax=marine sediment metagenome TaxID=412755 RepID=A0A0F9L706_9ZZZZ